MNRRLLQSCGLLLGLLPLPLAGELYLRFHPPTDLQPYLGDESPLSGPWRADAEFGVDYRLFDGFVRANADRLRPHLPLRNHPDARPVWAFFGNSFVQAPGMLADTAAPRFPDRRVFHLGVNEELPVRFAQIRLLLDNGLAPRRIFLVALPIDWRNLAAFPTWSWHVNPLGGRTLTPRPAPAWDAFDSRLALLARIRTGRHNANAGYDLHGLPDGLDPTALTEFRALHSRLADVLRKHRVPATIIFIPQFHHVRQGRRFGFEDQVGPILRELGFDVLDPRDAFLAHPKPAELHLGDKHLSPEGNRLLVDALERHLRQVRSTVQE